ncbi:MAG: DUF4382 domain-containing protein [Bacteroidales bacterium]|jgi:hypothetical protein
MKSVPVFLGILLLSAAVSSCNKDPKTYPVNVRMTDVPGPYTEVNIDLKEVELTGNDGNAVTMDVNAGVYNLLDFSNGMDTLIATGGLDVSEIQQIRLVLGSNNTVVVDGVSHPLSTPSAEQSGLKLQVHQTLEAGVLYTVLLDFDANKSILVEGNGSYKLKPVIRTIETAVSGAIRGKISPVGTLAVVTVVSDLSYTSNVTSGGDFILIGLPAGIYSLTVTPASPFNEFTQDNITVTTGVTTNVGTIVLH